MIVVLNSFNGNKSVPCYTVATWDCSAIAVYVISNVIFFQTCKIIFLGRSDNFLFFEIILFA